MNEDVIGVTIFTVMSKLANDVGAINHSQGFPDFDVSAELRHSGLDPESRKKQIMKEYS
jgi:hypothetical protein